MTARERTTFFDRLVGMREAYRSLDALDRAGITSITEAIADAERELAATDTEADAVSTDPAPTAHHPV